MYVSANGEPIYGSPNLNTQGQFINTGPGYNNGYMNQPVPPTLGDGYGVNGQPSTPGFHNVNDPYGYNGGGYNPYQQPSPYFQPSQQYFTGQSIYANPQQRFVFNNNYTPYQQFVPQQQDQIINVPGFRLSSNPLITDKDIMDVHNLFDDMMDEIDASQSNTTVNQNAYMYNSYYGYNPYSWNGWGTYGIRQKYNEKVQQIIDDAKERRLDWEKRLMRMCHHYMDDGVSDEESDKAFEGYTIRIPGVQIVEDREYEMLGMGVEIDMSNNPYAAHARELDYMYNQLAPNTDSMNEFFKDLSRVQMYDDFLEEFHRRRNPNRLYDSSGYRALIRKAKRRRDGNDITLNSNTNNDNNQNLNDLMSQPKGTVSKQQIETSILNDMGIGKYAHFENGSLTLNDPPDWVGRRPIVEEEMANVHLKDRDAFLKSIYQKDGGG